MAATGYFSQFDRNRPPFFLKPNHVPIRRWMVNILLFFTINVLNNHAFSYNISVPIHIILRSGGSITTIAAGYLWGKRFSRMQVFAVTLLTVGVVIAAWSDQQSKVGHDILSFGDPLRINRKTTSRLTGSLHSARVLLYSSSPKSCRPSWVYIPKKLTNNTVHIGRRICSTLIYSLFLYSCRSYHR